LNIQANKKFFRSRFSLKNAKALIAVIGILIVVLTSVLFFGCKTTSTAGQQYVFGYSPAYIEDPYWLRMLEGAQFECANQNVKLLWSDPRNEPATQIKIIEDFISTKVDFILVSPVDPESTIEVIERAVDSGIQVVTLGRDVNTEKRLAWRGQHEYEVGIMTANWIVKNYPDGANLLWVQGPRGASTIEELVRGAQPIFDKNPQIKILATDGKGFRREEALSITENWLQEFDDVDIIYGAYDELALGAMMAAEAANRLDEIDIIGFNYSADARTAFAAGKIKYDLMSQPGLMGVKGVQVAMDYLTGKNKNPEPIEYIPVVEVTQENYTTLDTKWAP
jgi:ABC-type sugar transport system substrate-binding protein